MEDAFEVLSLRHAAGDLIEQVGSADLFLKLRGSVGDAAFEPGAGLVEIEIAFLDALEHDVEAADQVAQLVIRLPGDAEGVILFLPDTLGGAGELEDGPAEDLTEARREEPGKAKWHENDPHRGGPVRPEFGAVFTGIISEKDAAGGGAFEGNESEHFEVTIAKAPVEIVHGGQRNDVLGMHPQWGAIERIEAERHNLRAFADLLQQAIHFVGILRM